MFKKFENKNIAIKLILKIKVLNWMYVMCQHFNIQCSDFKSLLEKIQILQGDQKCKYSLYSIIQLWDSDNLMKLEKTAFFRFFVSNSF